MYDEGRVGVAATIVVVLIVAAASVAVPFVMPLVWLLVELRRPRTPVGANPFGLTAAELTELNAAAIDMRSAQGELHRLRGESKGLKKRGDGKLDERRQGARLLNLEFDVSNDLQSAAAETIHKLSHQPQERWRDWVESHSAVWGIRIATLFSVVSFWAGVQLGWTRFAVFLAQSGGRLSDIPASLGAYGEALVVGAPNPVELIALVAPLLAVFIGLPLGRALGAALAPQVIARPQIVEPVVPEETPVGVEEEPAVATEGSANSKERVPATTEPAASADLLNVSGTWESEYEYQGKTSHVGIELTQTGAAIVGKSGKTKISGTLRDRVLIARWKEGRSEGELRFEFSADGQRFAGTWTTDGNTADAGAWNGKR